MDGYEEPIEAILERLDRTYEILGHTCGFEIDPCRAAKGLDKGKVERSVRALRQCFGDLFQEDDPRSRCCRWPSTSGRTR